MAQPDPGRVAQTRLRRLEAEATHARQRYELYKARVYGSRPTSPARLRDLERLLKRAEQRVARAKTDA